MGVFRLLYRIRGGCAGWHTWVANTFGWRWAFHLVNVLTMALIVLMVMVLPRNSHIVKIGFLPQFRLFFRSSYSAALLSAYCVRMSGADAMTVWLGAMRTPCAIFAGVMVSSMLVGMTIRETQLFRFFKQR